MLDPVVHAALVAIAAYLIKLLFEYLGFPLDEATLNTLAAAVVAYILSLFGLSFIRKLDRNKKLLGSDEYHPPFT